MNNYFKGLQNFLYHDCKIHILFISLKELPDFCNIPSKYCFAKCIFSIRVTKFYLRLVYYQNLERAKHVFGQSNTFFFGDVNTTNQKRPFMLKLWEIKYVMFNSQTAEQLICQEFLHKITNSPGPSFMTKRKKNTHTIISNVGQLG